jgi:hypothetical protein
MKLPVCLIVFVLLVAGRAPQPSERFKIVDTQYFASDVHLVLKIDTQTGETWRLYGDKNTPVRWFLLESN